MKFYSILLILIFLYSCSSKSDLGSAYLVDNGLLEANYRYQIIFKDSLSRLKTKMIYSINGVPSGDYMIGIETKSNTQNSLKCLIVLKMKDQFGNILLDFHDSIKKFTWSITRESDDMFGYIKNNQNEQSIYDSNLYLEYDKNYNINFEITPSNCIPENISFELIILQRGWK